MDVTLETADADFEDREPAPLEGAVFEVGGLIAFEALPAVPLEMVALWVDDTLGVVLFEAAVVLPEVNLLLDNTLGLSVSGGFKGWPGVAWPPHLKAHSYLYSSTTGMNCTDLYWPSEVISPTSLLYPLSSLYVCRATPPDRVIHALLKP